VQLDYTKLKGAGQLEDFALAPAEEQKLELKARDLALKEQEIRSFITQADQELERKRSEEMDVILADILAVVSVKAKEARCSLVLDKSAKGIAPGFGVVDFVHYSSATNITTDVIARLNQNTKRPADPNSKTNSPPR
jgi:Skp family chaperone for outer membrane proteins